MIALLTFFLLIVASLLATRLATVALTLTGLSPEIARFQARSALSGAGFTTSESEAVVNHPARRKIVMLLMLIGSAGLVTAVATLSISFVGQDTSASASRLLLLIIGCVLLLMLARSKAVDRMMSLGFGWLLTRYTDLELRDYEGLLHLSDGHSVLELHVDEGAWLCSRTLEELELREEGLAVLGIDREGGSYVGAPRGTTEIRPGDTLISYGEHDALVELSSRQPGPEGDRMHREAVHAHRLREQAHSDD